MKKYIAFLGACLYAAVAGAECVGGTEITANSMTNNPNGNCTAEKCNGATFCRSNGNLNWWSAFTWCASNGLHLVTFTEACPGIPTSANNVAGACPNLQGVDNQIVWTSLSVDSTHAYLVNLSDGSVRSSESSGGNYTKKYQSFKALCR